MANLIRIAALLFAVPAFALPVVTSFSPTSCPSPGGVTVTINGSGFTSGSVVSFGGIEGYDSAVVDEHTITARTPAHLPGDVTLRVDTPQGSVTTGGFTYTGHWSTAFERLLLPVFTPPVHGAYGSEFRTELEGLSYSMDPIFGFGATIDDPAVAALRFSTATIAPNGTPGRFLYTLKDAVPELGARLRVWDVSREASNYGTEMKIVRSKDFGDELIFPSVPTDARFRLTMRIYGDSAGATALVSIDNGQDETIDLRPGANLFEPSYGTFTNFPIEAGRVRVVVRTPPPVGPPPDPLYSPPVWAFITVTNNDTQQITTITPNN